MTYLPLTGRQRQRLREQLHQTSDARFYRRTLAILEFDRGSSVTDIADSLHTSRQSVYRWLEAYTATPRPAVLADAPRDGHPALLGGEQADLLQRLLALPSQALGLPYTVWSVPLLHETLEALAGPHVSSRTVRRALARLDYTRMRPRYVLAPDAELEGETASAPPDCRAATAQCRLGPG